MSIWKLTSEHIAHAKRSILADPVHNLAPFERVSIYALFGPLDDDNTRLQLGRLALLVVEKVLPIWEAELPENDWPHKLIRKSNDVLIGRISPTDGYEAAEEAYHSVVEWISDHSEQDPEYLEFMAKSGGITNESIVSLNAQCVLLAACAALYEVSGAFRFDRLSIEPGSTEVDLDADSIDPSGLAADAFAGPSFEDSSNAGKRQEFWEWWISEAVPLALSDGLAA